MFDLSDYLTGIYKVADCTQSVTIRNDHREDDPAPIASGVVTSTQLTEVASQTISNDPRVEEISIIAGPSQTVDASAAEREHDRSDSQAEMDGERSVTSSSEMVVDETLDDDEPGLEMSNHLMDTSTNSDVV